MKEIGIKIERAKETLGSYYKESSFEQSACAIRVSLQKVESNDGWVAPRQQCK